MAAYLALAGWGVYGLGRSGAEDASRAAARAAVAAVTADAARREVLALASIPPGVFDRDAAYAAQRRGVAPRRRKAGRARPGHGYRTGSCGSARHWPTSRSPAAG